MEVLSVKEGTGGCESTPTLTSFCHPLAATGWSGTQHGQSTIHVEKSWSTE